LNALSHTSQGLRLLLLLVGKPPVLHRHVLDAAILPIGGRAHKFDGLVARAMAASNDACARSSAGFTEPGVGWRSSCTK